MSSETGNEKVVQQVHALLEDFRKNTAEIMATQPVDNVDFPLSITMIATRRTSAYVTAVHTVQVEPQGKDDLPPAYYQTLLVTRDLIQFIANLNETHNLGFRWIYALMAEHPLLARLFHVEQPAPQPGADGPRVTMRPDGTREVVDLIEDGVAASAGFAGRKPS